MFRILGVPMTLFADCNLFAVEVLPEVVTPDALEEDCLTAMVPPSNSDARKSNHIYTFIKPSTQHFKDRITKKLNPSLC